MNRLKLSEIVKHNKRNIFLVDNNRSKQDTIDFYVKHYTDNWVINSDIDIDINSDQIKYLLTI